MSNLVSFIALAEQFLAARERAETIIAGSTPILDTDLGETLTMLVDTTDRIIGQTSTGVVSESALLARSLFNKIYTSSGNASAQAFTIAITQKLRELEERVNELTASSTQSPYAPKQAGNSRYRPKV